MKPFTIPKWRKALIDKKYARKAKVIAKVVDAFDAIVLFAIESVILHYKKTGHYAEPTLNGLEMAGEHFYRSVIKESVADAEDQKSQQGGKKKLAKAKGPTGIPNNLRTMEQIFRNPKMWPRIMKRNKSLCDSIRKQYKQKLARKFRDLVPRMMAGDISPDEAKMQMQDDWKASKSRVETIFRTETTNYFAKTQVSFFKNDPDIIGFLYDSIKDSSRTDICRSRHGLIYRQEYKGEISIRSNTPALHYNCRSHFIPLTDTPANRKMISDPRRDPAKVKVTPLMPGWRK